MIARWVEGSTGHTSWDAGLFAILFSLEILLKLIAWGSERVFSSGWHTFDVTSTLALVAAWIIASLLPQWDELLTFVRPLRLLRLFKLKKRYRYDINVKVHFHKDLLNSKNSNCYNS